MRQDGGDIIAVIPDELVPFEQQLGARSGAYSLVCLESLVGGLYNGIGILCCEVGTGREYFSGSWVCDRQLFCVSLL